MSRSEKRLSEDLAKGDVDIDGARRQLEKWVVSRSVACSLFVFTVMSVVSAGPFPLGPDYVRAAAFGAAAGGLAGFVYGFRAYLRRQQISAERAGVTLWYWVGRQVRSKLASWASK